MSKKTNSDSFASLIIKEQNLICYISDLETYELKYFSPACMAWFNINDATDYLGKKCYSVLQGLDKPCSFCTNCKLEKGKKLRWEYHNDKIDRWVKVEDTLIEIDDKNYRLEVVFDITSEREELIKLEKTVTTERALIECFRVLANVKNLEDSLDEFLSILGRFYNARRAYIYEINNTEMTMSNTNEWCRDMNDSVQKNMQKLPLTHFNHWLDKFKTDGEFYISSIYQDLKSSSIDFKILEEQNVDSLIAVPMIKNDEIIGFLGLDCPDENIDNWTLLHSVVSFYLLEKEKIKKIHDLTYISYTDMLTKLKNRNYLSYVQEAIKDKNNKTLSVLFLDLDNLKKINDTFGHTAGDEALKSISGILREVFSDSVVMRAGGDEFLVFIFNITKEELEERKLELYEKLLLNGISCSYGSSYKILNKKEIKINDMIDEAEVEMYKYKRIHHQNETI